MSVKPKDRQPLFQVLLLPEREVAARHQSLAEALAWARTYNGALASREVRAVIAEEVEGPTSRECQAA